MIRQVQEPEGRRCALCFASGNPSWDGDGPLYIPVLYFVSGIVLCRKCLERLQEELKDWKP